MESRRSWRSWVGILVLLSLGAACGQPRQAATTAALYARRPNLTGLDTSVLLGRRILIDPGHGGQFAGSRGLQETREADVNLGVALYLWGLLRDSGAEVFLTRASDRDLLPDSSIAVRDDLAERVALLDSLQPDVFLSLHHNSNAELDRERNTVETYYKLGDEGPSYDLARAVHRRLARDLGIARAQLRPGNYFVLRNAATAAVLGEASYLSNPVVESKLQLAEKQLLEAEAYFLGLVDYFSRGVPRIEKLAPAGDTLRLGEFLRFRLLDDPGGSIDPSSPELRVDSELVNARFDLRHGELALPIDTQLAPGRRVVEVRARNTRGNSARPLQTSLLVYAPPVRAIIHQEPERAAAGSEIRLTIHFQDALGRPVADGLPVALRGVDMTVRALEESTRTGSVIALARLVGSATPRLQVVAGSLEVEAGVRVGGRTPSRFIRVLDARDRSPLADAWLACADSSLERSDRAGLLLHPLECRDPRIERPGYVPWHGTLSVSDEILLVPLQKAALHEQRFILDPAGDGLELSHADWGLSAAEINLDISRLLAASLRAAGARVWMTRGASDTRPLLERVGLATRHAADWYVVVDHSLDIGSPPTVLHYPGSTQGEKLARQLALWLERRLQRDSVRVVPEARPILQQTPCPAVWVRLPGPKHDSLTTNEIAHIDTLRERAYALFVGIRSTLDPTFESLPPLVGSVQASDASGMPQLVILNGAEMVTPDARGRFRFECVPPGAHQLAFVESNATHEILVQVSGIDSTVVEVQLPIQRP